VHCGRAQRPEGEVLASFGLEHRLERRRPQGVGPHSGENSDGLVDESTQREPERVDARVVEPLGVVDGEHRRPVGCELPEDRVRRRGDRARVDGRTRGLAQERDVERPSLRLGQAGQDRLVDRTQQITERSKRERRLGTGRPRGKQAPTARQRQVDARLPHRRLPDPGGTRDRERARPVVHVAEEALDPLDLGAATDNGGPNAAHLPRLGPGSLDGNDPALRLTRAKA